ncbi:MAG: sulfatase family protein [Phycisphaerae bacterium]
MPEKPNIVYIMADDMGYGDPGCYGAEKIPTPNMDRLASEGMRFTDAHSSSAVCTPSRYSVLTGRYCWRTHLKRGVLGGLSYPLIDPARLTIAGLLKQQGYATAAVGKWHVGLGWQTREGVSHIVHDWEDDGEVDFNRRIVNGPVDVGFDYFFGIAGSLDMPPYCFIENDRTVGIPDRPKEHYFAQQRKGRQVPDWDDRQVDLQHARKACDWLRQTCSRDPDEPFFLYLTPSNPHRPCVPPEFLEGASDAGPRGDCVCVVDYVLGQVLDTLDELDLAEETMVVLTSDNGARPADVDRDTHGHRSCGELRGFKAQIWEGGHREPFLVRWPARVKPGTTCDQTICLMDMMATVADLTGTDLPENVAEDSFSFAPLLDGEPARPRRMLVHHSVDGTYALRRGTWKMILGAGPGGFHNDWITPPEDDGLPGQLYDMEKDWRETTNLWADRPDIVEEMKADLQAIIDAGRTRPA